MAKRDYYEVLGVSRTVTVEEIKKSFRGRARDLHPDNKVSGDEAAFKELAEAYEVLSDSEKRALYDRYGHEGVKGAANRFEDVDFSSFAGFGMDDLIDVFFGGGLRGAGRRSGPAQGAHLKYDLQIEFLDAVFGVEKKISIKRLEECTTCSGSGAAAESKTVSCTTCNGIGQVQQVVGSWFGQSIRVMECQVCQGAGQRIEKPCRDCRGEGLVRKASEVDLPIPAGIDGGSRLRVPGYGDKGKRGGPFGDLFVVVHVKEHESFVREGDTIHLHQPISYSMAALGGELMVLTVDGLKPIKIAAGTQSGATLTIKNAGVPVLGNNSRRGNQIIHLTVTTPTKLTNEERQLFAKLAELRGESLNLAAVEANKLDNKLKEFESDEKPSKNGDNTGKKASSSQEKEDSSLFEKIVEVFKPKHDEPADK